MPNESRANGKGTGVAPKVWRAYVDVELDSQAWLREFEAMRTKLERAAPGEGVSASILSCKLMLELLNQRFTQLLIVAVGEELK